MTEDERLSRAVEANVRWTMHQIMETPESKVRTAEGRMKLVGAVFEIATGRVRFLAIGDTPVSHPKTPRVP